MTKPIAAGRDRQVEHAFKSCGITFVEPRGIPLAENGCGHRRTGAIGVLAQQRRGLLLVRRLQRFELDALPVAALATGRSRARRRSRRSSRRRSYARSARARRPARRSCTRSRGRRLPRRRRRRRSSAPRSARRRDRGRRRGPGGAVEHGVADDHVLFGLERRVVGRPDREHAAREPLADVVVRVADERQLEARREPRAERLPGGAVKLVLAGVRAARASSCGATAARRPRGRRCARGTSRRPRSISCQSSASASGEACACVRRSGVPAGTSGARSRSSGRGPAPASARARRRARAGRRDRRDRRNGALPSDAMISRTSSATWKKYSITCSGLPRKRLRSSGSCVATPTGHVFRWQARIITQPVAINGAVANPISSAPSSAAIDDVPSRLELPVGLHPDARAEVVQHERLLRLRETDLPRDARVQDRRDRRGSRAAVVARDQHVIGVRTSRRRPQSSRRRPPRRASPRRARRDSRSAGRRSAA